MTSRSVPRFTGEVLSDKAMLREVVFNDAEEYHLLEEIKGDHGRWALGIDSIFKRNSDGKLFKAHWRKGATEYQEHEFPEEAHEVRAVPVTTFRYERV